MLFFFSPSNALLHIHTVTVNLGAAQYNHSILLKPVHSSNGDTVKCLARRHLSGTAVEEA